MIGRLAGRLQLRGHDHVMIDVQGVGYIVHVSERTLARLPATGEAVALFTELLVREDLLQLFGFLTLQEKEWHRLLMSVQGVGAKAAMAILGTLGAEALGRSIAMGDWASVKAAPGIGPKIAQRVVLELKSKAPAVMALGGALPEGGPAPGAAAAGEAAAPRDAEAADAAAAQGAAADAIADALSALRNLGYAPAEAAAAVAEAGQSGAGADSARLIRLALRRLAPRGGADG